MILSKKSGFGHIRVSGFKADTFPTRRTAREVLEKDLAEVRHPVLVMMYPEVMRFRYGVPRSKRITKHADSPSGAAVQSDGWRK